MALKNFTKENSKMTCELESILTEMILEGKNDLHEFIEMYPENEGDIIDWFMELTEAVNERDPFMC